MARDRETLRADSLDLCQLSRSALYVEAVARQDYEQDTIDEALTDPRLFRHRVQLYRRGSSMSGLNASLDRQRLRELQRQRRAVAQRRVLFAADLAVLRLCVRHLQHVGAGGRVSQEDSLSVRGVFGVRAQIRRAYGSPGGRGAMHRSEIGV